MIENEAFLAIENTMSKVLAKAVQSIAQEAHAQISELAMDGDYAGAYEAARQFNLRGVLNDIRGHLRELGLTSLIFGQQQLLPANLTALVQGTQEVPEELDTAIDQLGVMVERDLAEQISESFHQMILDLELEDGKVPLEKAKFSPLNGNLVKDAVQTGLDIRANLITSRLATFGFLTQAGPLNITTYQISEVLDSRICPVCYHMHGQTFEVQKEIGRVRNALLTQDPAELRNIAPWPSQTKEGLAKLRAMTPAEMQSAGYGTPPFHPGCRGILVKVGTVTLNPPLPIDKPKKDKVQEDQLATVGIKPPTSVVAYEATELVDHGLTVTYLLDTGQEIDVPKDLVSFTDGKLSIPLHIAQELGIG